jgi:hypothetical protein
MAGKQVSKFNTPAKPENIYTIDLGDQSTGYYLVKIIGNDFTKQFKILVNR